MQLIIQTYQRFLCVRCPGRSSVCIISFPGGSVDISGASQGWQGTLVWGTAGDSLWRRWHWGEVTHCQFYISQPGIAPAPLTPTSSWTWANGFPSLSIDFPSRKGEVRRSTFPLHNPQIQKLWKPSLSQTCLVVELTGADVTFCLSHWVWTCISLKKYPCVWLHDAP